MKQKSKKTLIISIVIISIILIAMLGVFFFSINKTNESAISSTKTYTFQTTKTCSKFMSEIGNPKMILPSNWKYTSRTDRCIQSYTNKGSGCKITYIKDKCKISIPGYDNYFNSNPRIYNILSSSIKNYYDPITIESQRWDNFKLALSNEEKGTNIGTSFNYYKVLAHSIYIDKNRLVPWKLNNYDDTDLSIIFSENSNVGNPTKYIYECSPSSTFDYTKKLIKSNQKETIYSIVDSLRRFTHFGYTYVDGVLLPDNSPGIGCIGSVLIGDKINGCHASSQLMAELSRNLNIPSYYKYYDSSSNWYIMGHGGVVFSKVAYLPHGDMVYGSNLWENVPANKLLIPWSTLQNKIIPKEKSINYTFGHGENPIEQKYMQDLLIKYPKN